MKAAKVISLLQPWATLSVMGLKKIETRSWSTNYRGVLLIHASAGKAGKLIAESAVLREYIPDYNALAFGCIIGQVELTDVVRISDLRLQDADIDKMSLEERAFGDSKARFAWLFADAEIFEEPIPATGRLGLWEF